MKISGKFILKVAGTLTVIALVVAALLGVVNNVTKDKIAEQDAENTRIAMSAVAPEGSEFGDKMDISDAVAAAASAQGGKIVEMYPMTNGGADAGYVVKVSASGSQGTITMMALLASTPIRPSRVSPSSAIPRPPASARRSSATSPTPPVSPFWISSSA